MVFVKIVISVGIQMNSRLSYFHCKRNRLIVFVDLETRGKVTQGWEKSCGPCAWWLFINLSRQRVRFMYTFWLQFAHFERMTVVWSCNAIFSIVRLIASLIKSPMLSWEEISGNDRRSTLTCGRHWFSRSKQHLCFNLSLNVKKICVEGKSCDFVCLSCFCAFREMLRRHEM